MRNDMDHNENPDKQSLSRRARLLRSLHDGAALVLPNAWDAASAALVAGAGARAIATTSGAVAWSLGHADGEQLTRQAPTPRQAPTACSSLDCSMSPHWKPW